MPLVCNYYVTLRCNEWCSFCNIPQTNNKNPPPEPTTSQIEANFRDLKRLGVRILDITGGEPFLYRGLVDMVHLAKRMGFMVSITTNGLLYPRSAEALKGQVDALLFSLDGASPQHHDPVRGIPRAFEKTMHAIEVARRQEAVVYISHTVTNESIDRVDEMVRFSRENGVIIYLSPCFSFFGNEGLSKENAQRLVAYFGRPGVIMDRAQLRLIIEGGNQKDAPLCKAVTSTVVVSPDDRLLLPCYHFAKQGLPIEGRLYELVRSPAVREAAAMQGRYDFCQGCTVYCYMRTSLAFRYPVDWMLTGAQYVRERVRARFFSSWEPPETPRWPAPVPRRTGGTGGEGRAVTERASEGAVVSARRRLPLAAE